MTRQEANRKIFSILKAQYANILSKEQLDEIANWIEKFPDGRFGQIICNWICPDYRDNDESAESAESEIIMESLFPGNPDPFFEESTETLERLKEKLGNL